MKCAVHTDVDAVGYCRNCGKAMCSACVRPVRDVLYCEDCLATIMGLPAPVAAPAIPPASAPPGAAPFVPNAYPMPAAPGRASTPANPGVAFILGFVPGLGAVYNGEYNKALIHVVVFVALVLGASSDIDTGPMVILILGAVGFSIYMAFDSLRTAKAKSLGETSADPLESWTKNRPVGPIILIGLGLLFLLNNFDWFSFHRIGRFFWPAILIGVGILMFRNRLNRNS
jgi:hypothetical protein